MTNTEIRNKERDLLTKFFAPAKNADLKDMLIYNSVDLTSFDCIIFSSALII